MQIFLSKHLGIVGLCCSRFGGVYGERQAGMATQIQQEEVEVTRESQMGDYFCLNRRPCFSLRGDWLNSSASKDGTKIVPACVIHGTKHHSCSLSSPSILSSRNPQSILQKILMVNIIEGPGVAQHLAGDSPVSIALVNVGGLTCCHFSYS